MVKIVEYNAQDRKLLTDNQGFEAYQRSGRVIRGFEQDIGRDISEAGKLQGQTIRERAWPFDIAELDQHLVEQQAAKTPRISFGRGRGGGGSSDSFRGPDFRGQDESTISGYAAHGQISRGAGALGHIARGLGKYTGDDNTEQVIDTATGETVSYTRSSNPDQQIDPTTGKPIRASEKKQQDPYTLENGRFVPARDKKTGLDTEQTAEQAFANDAQSWYTGGKSGFDNPYGADLGPDRVVPVPGGQPDATNTGWFADPTNFTGQPGMTSTTPDQGFGGADVPTAMSPPVSQYQDWLGTAQGAPDGS